MARYDYYRVASGDAFLLDIQSDWLEGLNTRAVVPLLRPAAAPVPARRLNPAFSIEGNDYVMVTQFISAVSQHELPVAQGTLTHRHDDIVAALDMLFHGF